MSRRRLGGVALTVALVGVFAYVSVAYAPSYVGTPAATQTIAWPTGATVNYKQWTGNAAATNVTGGAVTAAIDAAMATAGTAAGLSFVNTGTQSGTGDIGFTGGSFTSNGANLISMANTTGNVAAVGGALAITAFFYSVPGNTIVETDMVFNPAFNFTTNATAGQYDLQAVATHEAGHALGLDHSPLCHASMFPFVYPDQTILRSFERDDEAGVRQLYPTAPVTFPPGYGTVTGTILKNTGGGAAGAHVFLTDVIRGTVGPGAVATASGAFSISGVPVGVYKVTVEPINGPMNTSNLSFSGWNGITFSTSFLTTSLGGNATPTFVPVRAAVASNVGNITVTTTAPALNPTAATASASGTGGFGFSSGRPAVFAPGAAQFIQIWGIGFNTLPDGAFSIDSPYVTISGPSTNSGSLAGSGFKSFAISVNAAAPPGGYAIKMTNAGETAYGAGLVVVTPPTVPVASVQSFGVSCPAVGAITMTTQGVPSIGNAAFQLRANGTTAGRTAYFLLSGNPDAFVSAGNFSGAASCSIYVDLNNLIFPFPGLVAPATAPFTVQPIPVPNTPALSGTDVYAQVAEIDTATGAIKVTQGMLLAVR